MRVALLATLMALFPTSAWATIPTWSCVTTNDADGTDGVTLNVGSPSAGQLVVVWAVADGLHTSIATPTGFTVLQASTDDANMVTASFYKFASGSEGATVSVGALGGSADDNNWIACKFTGAHASTAPETATRATGSSANPDPPSLNPTGWGTEDTLWIESVGEGADVGAAGFTASSGYGNAVTQGVGGGANSWVGIAFRSATTQTASEDPGTATTGDTVWAANTIAIRPAVPNSGAHPLVNPDGPLNPFVNGGLVN